MLKSPEEYLSGLSFDLPDARPGPPDLDSAERVFVEKYLGSDSLPDIPVQEPEPLPMPRPEPLAARPVRARKPEIIVAPAPKIAIAPDVADDARRGSPQVRDKIVPQIVVVEEARQANIEEPQKAGDLAVNAVPAVVAAQKELLEILARPAAQRVADVAPDIAPPKAQEAVKAEVEQEIAPVEAKAAVQSADMAQAAEPMTTADAIRAFTTARDKLKQASQVQAVSFTVAGQLFLLPVEGIQEVLRYMELVKVPQAPEYVAGAINLRGAVMPLIHLSALLTNSKTWKYDEHSFIIVTGSSSIQMGLIIDKVSSMHMIPQQKIIWNAESKLGDAAEFLCSIVDLDDRICGMIAPDTIAQKLLSEF